MLGHWKDFEELEDSLSMPELTSILKSKRELEFEQRKFFAALQGVDLDGAEDEGQKKWEDIKAKAFSGVEDSNDIISLQGINAQQAGFGIGMGLEYTNAKDLSMIPQW